MIKNILALVGAVFLTLWLASNLGIGDFRFYYGAVGGCEWCTK